MYWSYKDVCDFILLLYLFLIFLCLNTLCMIRSSTLKGISSRKLKLISAMDG